MTTERQRLANRRNAQQSTGPRTSRGKASSSRNARRHGLTGAGDLKTVVAWYRVILEDPDAVPKPFEQHPYLRAAGDLARAEAQLQRVRLAEDKWLLAITAASQAEEGRSGEAYLPAQETDDEVRRTRAVRGMSVGLSEPPRPENVPRQASAKDLDRTLARYRALAEARRRKALRRWTTEIAKRSQCEKVRKMGSAVVTD